MKLAWLARIATACALLVPAVVLAQTQTVSGATISPTSTPAGLGTTVVVTATITDQSLIASTVNLQKVDALGRASVVGALHDDGQDGDVAANDKVYSIRLSVFEDKPATLKFRVSAAFQGKALRVFSNTMSFSVTGTVATGVSLTQPANLAFVGTAPIIVTGTVGDPKATVAVNGIQASRGGSGFQASIPLLEGNNTVTAVATNSNGSTSTSSIQVTLDTTPPRLSVQSPLDGSTTTEPAVTVTGIVNDIVVGTVNAKQAAVTVGGTPAQVANRTFTIPNVPIKLGLNTIPIVATDQVGNSATLNLKVAREAVSSVVIKLVSGNNQSGVVGSALASPLVVQVLNGAAAVPDVPVIFKVIENDGSLQPSAVAKSQLIVVKTNAEGKSQATLTLGNRAGAGNNVVQVYGSGIQGTAVFTASGTPKAAAQINVDSGSNQFGPVGQQLPLPFVAVVTDLGYNRLAGVPVTFKVTQGAGNIKGQTAIQTVTDSDGRALASLVLGPQPGQDNNVVEATFPGNAGFAAAFSASGKVPGDPTQTSISGVVLDNSNNPIQNVTMRVYQTNQGTNNNQHLQVGTPVTTDIEGLFKIQPAPVGFFKLMADGTTVTPVEKKYPTLEYDIVTVAGQENTVGSPIYLPLLDPNAKLCVTDSTGGVLTLPQAPGFSLKVAPGSATFPGGSKSGCISVTPVNPDKVPMVPGFGQQPRYVVTIQPVGTTFNPPAAITIPNLDGLTPNAKTEMYSYDHDLAAFVAIGSATVSADGSVIASDPGIGVIKAGWHCGGNPNPTGSTGHCAKCKKCESSSCVIDPKKNGRACDSADALKSCLNGKCIRRALKVKITTPTSTPMDITQEPRMPSVTFTAEIDPPASAWKSVSFSWHAIVTFDENGRTDSHSVPATNSTTTTNGKWSPVFGQDFYGGKVHVYVEASADGQTASVDVDGYRIRGINPTEAVVKEYAGTSPWFLSRMIRAESSYRQFSPNPGSPLFGPPSGWGLLQPDPPEFEVVLWNWKKNIDKGKTVLQGKRGASYDFWERQVQQYLAWIKENPDLTAPRPDNTAPRRSVWNLTLG